MPARHSKNSGDRAHFSHHEKARAGMGSIKQRLGTDSQLPFGYCALSMQPVVEPVVSPSGRLYSRESILEYLLTKSKELKQQWKEYEAQKELMGMEEANRLKDAHAREVESFLIANDRVGKRKADSTEASSEYDAQRRKLIDDTEHDAKIDQLRKVCPWVPQFTPQAAASLLTEPPKRPPSPFSGRPLRAKDLIPVNLIKDPDSSSGAGLVRFVCPVTRKTITNQKVVLIKPSATLMLAETAEQLAYPTMTCPVTGQKFKKEDVMDIVPAASAFSASGNVQGSVHRPTIN